jgi:uncharacterized repeat protein (TIGR01451 family)
MKTMLRSLLFLVNFTFVLNSVSAQSWEVFYGDLTLGELYNSVLITLPNNEVGLAFEDVFNPQVAEIHKLDAFGNFIGKTIPNLPLDWSIINTDSTGSTYWSNLSGGQIKKLSANNNVLWTYITPNQSGTVLETAMLNGQNCQLYYDDNSSQIVDMISSEGNPINRFHLPDSASGFFYTGTDNSLIYQNSQNPDNWTKINQNNQIAWNKTITSSSQWVGTVSDGSTYYSTGSTLSKFKANGDLAWEKDLNIYFLNDGWFGLNGLLERKDGSLILVAEGFSFSSGKEAIFLSNVNPHNGDLIWKKNTQSDFSSLGVLSIKEMSDGGILCNVWCLDPLSTETILIIRTDPQGNTISNQISGTIHLDSNNDCITQTTELPMKQFTVIAQSGTKVFSATSDQIGQFSLPVSSGNYQISVAQIGSYWDYCGFTNPVALNPSYDSVQIAVVAQANILCPEMHVSIGSNVFRRCFDNNYLSVKYQNLGTMPANNATVTITLDPELIYISATAPLLSQNGQDYTFSIGTVDILSGGVFSINFKVDCDAEMGKLICASAHVFPDSLCIQGAPRLSENSFCLPVVDSYDPNDKTALVDGKPETATILPDLGLEYLIRFQNTGNDTAFNIVIVDTLSALLDATSVLPGAASHPYTFELLEGKILRFSFKNILLPDSNTNEVASHGFIKFAVRQKANNPIGSLLRNQAAIYFDFNAPIFTNDTRLVVQPFVVTQEAHIYVQPNITPVPAFDGVNVQSAKDAPAIVAWKLMDMTGRVLQEENVGSDNFFVPRHGLPSGVYGLQFRFENGVIGVGKVIFE